MSVFTYEIHPRTHAPGWRLFLMRDADEVGGGIFPPGADGHADATADGQDWVQHQTVARATYPHPAAGAGEPVDAQSDRQPVVGKSDLTPAHHTELHQGLNLSPIQAAFHTGDLRNSPC